jgi:hypothetical protein
MQYGRMIIVAVTSPDAASAGERKLPIELFISVSSVPTAFDSNRILFSAAYNAFYRCADCTIQLHIVLREI